MMRPQPCGKHAALLFVLQFAAATIFRIAPQKGHDFARPVLGGHAVIELHHLRGDVTGEWELLRQWRRGGDIGKSAVGRYAVHVIAVDGVVTQFVDHAQKGGSVVEGEFVQLVAVGVDDPVVGVDRGEATQLLAVTKHGGRTVYANPR